MTIVDYTSLPFSSQVDELYHRIYILPEHKDASIVNVRVLASHGALDAAYSRGAGFFLAA